MKNKIIFITPLDWGLGHATRCVPLIKQLMRDNKIILGITPTTQIIFNEEFSDLQKINIEPYNIQYSNWLPIPIKLLLDSPRILRVIKKEHQQLKDIIKKYSVDVVISDNRFGLWNQSIESIYITHQLTIQAGLFSFFANKIHHHFIKKFNQVWVPDIQINKNLAGKLSLNTHFKNVTYIGALSRLEVLKNTENRFDYLIVLSGVEPQRTILEKELLQLAQKSTKRICIVRGSAMPINTINNENIQIINYANAEKLAELIQSSNAIICRSGYSTLMDLYTLKKENIILIPTPSQTEQGYLANYWKEQFGAMVILQKNIKSHKSLFLK